MDYLNSKRMMVNVTIYEPHGIIQCFILRTTGIIYVAALVETLFLPLFFSINRTQINKSNIIILYLFRRTKIKNNFHRESDDLLCKL